MCTTVDSIGMLMIISTEQPAVAASTMQVSGRQLHRRLAIIHQRR